MIEKKCRSFVNRKGRITQAQKRALGDILPKYNYPDQLNYEKIVLEIGFGNGENIIQSALKYPEIGFLGIDVYLSGIGNLLLNLEQNAVSNIQLAVGDAVELLKNIQDSSLFGVQVFFPDPWPKKRHHKRRLLLNKSVLNLIRAKLREGGFLHFATDWQNYFDEFTNLINSDCKNWQKSQIILPRFQTKYERRGLNLGHAINDICLQKKI